MVAERGRPGAPGRALERRCTAAVMVGPGPRPTIALPTHPAGTAYEPPSVVTGDSADTARCLVSDVVRFVVPIGVLVGRKGPVSPCPALVDGTVPHPAI